MTKSVKIVYPIFLSCCKYAENVFWYNLFEELAYGNTPYSMYFYKRKLCSSSKGREFNYTFDGVETKKLYTDLHRLIRESGIISEHEHTQRRHRFYSIDDCENMNYNNWKNIKRKIVREMLIEKYVIDKKNVYNLSMKQSKKLLSSINMAITFKIITSDDITIENGVIVNIGGFEFTHPSESELFGSFSMINVYEKLERIASISEIKSTKRLSDCWSSFLKNLYKSSSQF